MMIKKRLTISNILMLIIPIVLIVVIAAIALDGFTDAYRGQLMAYQQEFIYGGHKGLEIGIDVMLLNMKSLIISYLGAVLLMAVAIIAITNKILTSRFAKSILVPLDQLRAASNQIKEGNLDFELKYEGRDEFKEVCTDFDEMRLRLKDLVESQLRYEADRKELVADISHDLRTPITTIKGYAEGLRDGVANTPEKQINYLNTIYDKACSMEALVDSLALFSKMDTNSYPFHFEKAGFAEYLEEYFGKTKTEFYLKGLQIFFENHCAEDVYVKLDQNEMGRVLNNIFENSVKYKTSEIGSAKAELTRNGGNIVLTIADDGPGVETEDLAKLFTRFYRADLSRTNPQAGSGLGLAIAKHIVNAHDGTIAAQNEHGLKIEITLPVLAEETE
jgi:signal transduction histidine kinase